jgi:hypothetical protein
LTILKRSKSKNSRAKRFAESRWQMRIVSERFSTNKRRFGNPVRLSKALLAVTSVVDPTIRVGAPVAERMIAARESTQR